MLSPELIGGLIARMMDVVVFFPSIVVGLIFSTWRSIAFGYFVTLAIVFSIKVPAISRMAERLDIPMASLSEIAIWYAISIAIWVSAVLLVRRLASGKWPMKKKQ